MALRGDHDIFAVMDEMSSQQGYQKEPILLPLQQQSSIPAAIRLLPEVKGYPSNKRLVGSQQIWNPYPKVEVQGHHSAAPSFVVPVPTNPQMEVLRRRAYEQFKDQFKEMISRADGNSKKKGPSNLWKELSIPSLLERWQFDAKLQEYLHRTTTTITTTTTNTTSNTTATMRQPSGVWTCAQVKSAIAIAKRNDTWIDPILISSTTSKSKITPTPQSSFVEELKFEWTRAWRRFCGVKTRDQEVQAIFTSNKFRKKAQLLSRSMRDVAMAVETKMMEELSKRVTLESTQHGRKQFMLPKLTHHDDDTVKVSYSGLVFTIHQQHYQKLEHLYDRQNQTSVTREQHEDGFVSALFALLARYDMLQGAGLQSALPGKVFDLLLQEFNSTMECFASPLNCRYERFCSAFSDTDAAFGSVGSFFDYDFTCGGCYQANPPFVANFILAMYSRMEEYLEKTTDALMFVVFVPAWKETSGWKALEGSSFLGHCETMSQESHYYTEGTQHRRKDRFRVASFDTSVFFLQNESAKSKWPVTSERIAMLQSALAHNPMSTEVETDETYVTNVQHTNTSSKKRKVGTQVQSNQLESITKRKMTKRR